jgi:DNA-binding NarL/FixJ family response regulator
MLDAAAVEDVAVFLVDDHTVVRAGLAAYLRAPRCQAVVLCGSSVTASRNPPMRG